MIAHCYSRRSGTNNGGQEPAATSVWIIWRQVPLVGTYCTACSCLQGPIRVFPAKWCEDWATLNKHWALQSQRKGIQIKFCLKNRYWVLKGRTFSHICIYIYYFFKNLFHSPYSYLGIWNGYFWRKMEEIQDEHENTAKGESGEEDFLHDWYLEQGLDELTKFDGRNVDHSSPNRNRRRWRIRGCGFEAFLRRFARRSRITSLLFLPAAVTQNIPKFMPLRGTP